MNCKGQSSFEIMFVLISIIIISTIVFLNSGMSIVGIKDVGIIHNTYANYKITSEKYAHIDKISREDSEYTISGTFDDSLDFNSKLAKSINNVNISIMKD